ncbi:complement C1q-like protein 4 isoform X2 [Sardina pilchardus]|uniref:complement C1q-like protein 4 isoform X2 n=1 Tax=Sardina pilchardus TaxID=27697 RepID=UPI002E15A4A3
MKTAVAVLLLLWSGVVGVVAAAEQSCLTEVRAVQREVIALVAQQTQELQLAKAHVEKQIEDLKNGVRPSNVAFSASLFTNNDTHIGPFKTDQTLQFNLVFTNVGNAYDNSTGKFTAPLNGVYQFSYHVYAGGDNGAGAKLYHNEDQVVAAYNHVAPHDINTSQSVILTLEKGDTVSLLLEAGWWVASYLGHLTTFSGHLLFGSLD